MLDVHIVPLSWHRLVGLYLQWLESGGCTEATVTCRYYKIGYIARLLGCDPFEVTGEMLVSVFASQSWARETRKGYSVTVRSFYRFLVETEEVDVDPTVHLPRVHRERSVPHPCPDRVIRRALTQAGGDVLQVLMIRLGAECGLRRSEIAQVSTHDVISVEGSKFLLIHGKGRKERMVPLPDDLAELIMTQHGFVFPGRWAGHVEASFIAKRVTRLLEDGYTTHSLRHRYASKVYEHTHDLLLVSKLLGHESVETTQVYLSVTFSNPMDVINAVQL